MKALEQVAQRTQRRTSAQIRSAAPPVPHRGDAPGPTGGSLASRAASRSLLQRGRNWVAINWPALGQPLLLFNRGSKRQKARPVDLSPTVAEVESAVTAALVRDFEERERRVRR